MPSELEIATADLPGLVAAIGAMRSAGDDAERIDRIRHFEELKAALCAAQALEAAAFDASQCAAQAAAGVPVQRRGRGVGAQIGLAMRTSHHAGQKFLGWAKIGPNELPCTFALLQAGRISEWKAMIVARETAALRPTDRAIADIELAPRLGGWGVRTIETRAREIAYRLDAQGALARCSRAREQRRVGCRPIPDTMARLSAELPVEHAVACYAALRREADRLIGVGDPRTRSQVMADTLVERVTGRSRADHVPIEVLLLMTDTALLGRPGEPGYDEPAWVPGYGPVPADVARGIARTVPDELTRGAASRRRTSGPPRWIRRLYRHPTTGRLAAMDTRRREFTANQRLFLLARDGLCRTPYCDAPIRHLDHVRPRADGGPTSIANGQGYCEACNHAKQAPGWQTTVDADGSIITRTPTGHTYLSEEPDLPEEPPRCTAERADDDLRRLQELAESGRLRSA